MFKKPPSNIKTSAPLRSSERRKLRNIIAATFSLEQEVVDSDLFPEPIFAAKFKTGLASGVLYTDAAGDPRWFTTDRSDELVPTVYTLRILPDLLPAFWTGSGVVPILLNGADLMIPGVVHYPESIPESQLVSVRRYSREPESGSPLLSCPFAVGRAALSTNLIGKQTAGKAVLVLHTWKDALWNMGKTLPDGDLPEVSLNNATSLAEASESNLPVVTEPASTASTSSAPVAQQFKTCSPEEVSELLHASLVRAIGQLGSDNGPSFPLPASTFFSSYVLPCRPAYPAALLGRTDDLPVDPLEISIKASTHKSLITFLKGAEKDRLLTLKLPQKHSNQNEVLIVSVNRSHPLVHESLSFGTIGEAEVKATKRAQREEKQKEEQLAPSIEIIELFKPHSKSIPLFERIGRVVSVYSAAQVKQLLNEYITSEKLVDTKRQAYINLDSLLTSSIPPKTLEDVSDDGVSLKREDLLAAVLTLMQDWHEVHVPGRDVVRKKGKIAPIELDVKAKQGRKAVTTCHGFEPFLIIQADSLAEDLRKLCAGSTSIGPIPGKPASAGVEVSVQGKQTAAVANYLISNKGIPKRWVHIIRTDPKKK